MTEYAPGIPFDGKRRDVVKQLSSGSIKRPVGTSVYTMAANVEQSRQVLAPLAAIVVPVCHKQGGQTHNFNCLHIPILQQ